MSEYYKKINTERTEFGEEYWGTILDPDGVLRNRIEEKDKFLKNVKPELDFINSLPPSKILDVGCGLGFFLAGIDDKHEKFGLEVSSYASAHAADYATIYNTPLEELEAADDSFDVVISHHVIEHVDVPEVFVEKIRKILKPDGLLVLSTPDFESVCAKLFKENYRMLYDKTHVSLFSFKSLKNMLEDLGFEVIKVEFPYFETEYYNENNILKMLNYKSGEISPACWGNFMTFYCKNRK